MNKAAKYNIEYLYNRLASNKLGERSNNIAKNVKINENMSETTI